MGIGSKETNKEIMQAWEIVSDVLKLVSGAAQPGMTTLELNDIGEKRVLELGGTPYNKGYHPQFAKTPFPFAMCIGVNNQLAHGFPSDYKLQEGDLVSFDLGVKKDDVCGDGALTIGIGAISNKDERLLYYARKTLEEGIKVIKAGIQTKEIAKAMETYAGLRGYVINHNFSGHAIGKEMHEDPMIPHVTLPGFGEEALKEGQMICLEPILTYKDKMGRPTENGWTWETRDGKKSAIFEKQILVKKDGYEILTTHF